MKTYFYPCTALVSGGGLAGSDAIWPSSFSDPLLIDLAGVDSSTVSSTVNGCRNGRTDGADILFDLGDADNGTEV